MFTGASERRWRTRSRRHGGHGGHGGHSDSFALGSAVTSATGAGLQAQVARPEAPPPHHQGGRVGKTNINATSIAITFCRSYLSGGYNKLMRFLEKGNRCGGNVLSVPELT